VSAWGPPPARAIYQTGGSLGPPSLEARRLRLDTLAQCVEQLCRTPCTTTLASASQIPKPVSFALRSHLAVAVMSRSTRARWTSSPP
jgi:hypothetical protein